MIRLAWLILFILVIVPASAQTCPTRPSGDNTNACASTAFVHSATGGTIPITVPNGGTGRTSFTANLPLIGNGTGAIAQGTRQGNTTSFATTTGAFVAGNCRTTDGSGNEIDAGFPCNSGSGSGTVSAGTAGQLAYYASSGTTVSGTFTPNFAATGNWFSDSGANIQRWNDRTQLGGGTLLDGKASPVTKDWLTTYTSTTIDGDWPANHSVLLVENQPSSAGDVANGATAITGASQTLNSTIANNGPQGIVGWCLNNNTTLSSYCWGIYAEADRQNSTVSATYGIETDVRNLGNDVPLDPFNWGPNDTVALNVECGAGVSSPAPNPCSGAMAIGNNQAQFDAGIVFLNNSVATISSHISAISLPPQYALNWFNSGGSIIGSIYSDGSGNMNINTTGGLLISGVPGLTCSSGITASTFRSVEGIVTHC